MDKLELDARVARLERRVGVLWTAFALASVGVVALLFFALVVRKSSVYHPPEPPATAISMPTPMPMEFVTATAPASSEGSMPALQHQLNTFHDLCNQGLISEEEWQAKKAKLLSAPVTAGDIRSDLQQVQQLVDTQAICESEREALRAQLLGIEE